MFAIYSDAVGVKEWLRLVVLARLEWCVFKLSFVYREFCCVDYTYRKLG